jgi:hypothetical protein
VGASERWDVERMSLFADYLPEVRIYDLLFAENVRQGLGLGHDDVTNMKRGGAIDYPETEVD